MAEESRIKELERLIKESDEKIKLKNSLIEQISKDLGLKEEEVRLARDEVTKFTSAKILTRKEIDELRQQEARNLLKKIAEERLNVDSETKKSLKHAEKIRESAQHESEDKRVLAYISALKTEISALEKATVILSDMLHEKENSAEDLLAENAIKEFSITKCKKEIHSIQASKSDSKELLPSLREKIAALKKDKSHTHSLYLNLKKEIEAVASKLYGYEHELSECLEGLKFYSGV